jgi:hypothetical protein
MKGGIGGLVVGLLWLVLTIVNYVRIENYMNDVTATGDLTVWGPLASLYTVDNYTTVSVVQGLVALVVIVIAIVPLVLAMRKGSPAPQPGVPAGATWPVNPTTPAGQPTPVASQDPTAPAVQ